MSVRQADRITQGLLDKGLPADAMVHVAADVKKPNRWLGQCRLDTLPVTLEQQKIKGCALFL